MFFLGPWERGAAAWTVRNPDVLSADIVRFPAEAKNDDVSSGTTEAPRALQGTADTVDIYGLWKHDGVIPEYDPRIASRPTSTEHFSQRLPSPPYRPRYPVYPTMVKRYHGPEISDSGPRYWYGPRPPPRDYYRPSGSRPIPTRYDYGRYPPRYPDFPSRYIVEKLGSYLRRPCHGPQCHHRRKGPVPLSWRQIPYPMRGYYAMPATKYPFTPPQYFAYNDHEDSESAQESKPSPHHNYGKKYKKRYYAYYYPYGSKYGYGPLPPYSD